MQIKNASFVDKHIEKVVLGVAALIALIVLWVFWLGSPYEVELRGAAEPKAPGEVGEFIASRAERLDRAINSEQSPLKLPAQERRADLFKQELARTVLEEPGVLFAQAGLPGVPGDVITPQLGPVPVYAMSPPPAPTLVSVRHRYDVAAKLEKPQEDARLARLIGAGEPRDFFSVLVRGKFDQAAAEDKWANPKQGEPVRQAWRVPTARTLIDVVLERETWDPVALQWTDRRVIDRIPGDIIQDVRTVDFSKMTPQQRRAAVEKLREAQPLIREPAFLKLAKGVWSPTMGNLSPEQLNVLMEISEQIRKKEQERVTTEKRIELIQKRGSKTSTQPADSGYQPGGYEDSYEDGYEDTYEDHGPPSSTPPKSGFSPAGKGALEREMEKLGRLNEEIAGLRMQKEKLMSEVDGVGVDEQATEPEDAEPEPGAPANGGGGLFGDTTEREGSVEGAPVRSGPRLEEVPIWAHDITVKSGRTYRYRLVTKVLNPLFNKTGLHESQQPLADQLMVASEPSAWSGPVRIPPRVHYFLKKVDRNRVIVDVFVLHDGVYQTGELRLEAGDPIAGSIQLEDGTAAPVDTGAILVGIARGTGRDFIAIIATPGQSRLSRRDPYRDQQGQAIKQIRAEIDVRKRQNQMNVDSPWGGGSGYEDGYEDERYEDGMYEDPSYPGGGGPYED